MGGLDDGGNKMIDYIKSAELNGMSVDELKAYFTRYPQSAKRVFRICDHCKNGKWVRVFGYTDFCKACAHHLPILSNIDERDRFVAGTQIDRIVTAEKTGYDPVHLKQKSNRKVWRVCKDCGDGRLVRRSQAHDRCHGCKLKTKNARKNMSNGARTRILGNDNAR